MYGHLCLAGEALDDAIVQYSAALQYFEKDNVLHEETKIFGKGLVNSLFAMQLILYIEKQYKIKVENTDLNLNNFMTLKAIAAFVRVRSKSPSFQRKERR